LTLPSAMYLILFIGNTKTRHIKLEVLDFLLWRNFHATWWVIDDGM